MNRRTALTLLGVASMAHVESATAQEAVPAPDSQAVRAWLDNYAASWAASDARRMYQAATEDLEWINIVGMHWRGKAEVVAAHEAYLKTMFRGVPFTLKALQSVRTVGSDVVVAVALWSVGQFNAPDGAVIPAADDRMTLLFHRTPSGLVLAHGVNVQIDPVAARFDPVKQKSRST